MSSALDPAAQPGASPVTPRASEAQSTPEHLFDQEALRDFRARWDQIQTSFVDDPRHAVEQANALVGAVIRYIDNRFAEERARLEKQWSQVQNLSTEELRQNFQRYRAFFDRLLSF